MISARECVAWGVLWLALLFFCSHIAAIERNTSESVQRKVVFQTSLFCAALFVLYQLCVWRFR